MYVYIHTHIYVYEKVFGPANLWFYKKKKRKKKGTKEKEKKAPTVDDKVMGQVTRNREQTHC